jgi:hypothetical protein
LLLITFWEVGGFTGQIFMDEVERPKISSFLEELLLELIWDTAPFTLL